MNNKLFDVNKQILDVTLFIKRYNIIQYPKWTPCNDCGIDSIIDVL